MDRGELDLATEFVLKRPGDSLGDESLHRWHLDKKPHGEQQNRHSHDNRPEYLERLSHNLQIYQKMR